MPPVRTVNIRPPLKVISQGNGAVGRRENHRTCDKIFRRRPRLILRPGFAFRNSDISRGLYEFRKFRIGDIGSVHPKPIDVNAVDRPRINGGLHADGIFRWGVLCPHGKLTARDPGHSRRRRARGRILVFNRRRKAVRVSSWCGRWSFRFRYIREFVRLNGVTGGVFPEAEPPRPLERGPL